jgi:hypothetical protein
MAVLAAALYFTATLSAEFVFKSDLLSKLEAHVITALAVLGYLRAQARKRD